MAGNKKESWETNFVSSRCIHDNIIIAQEMIHSMRRMRAKKGFMLIKVNLEKAYDGLKWGFIHNTLLELRLPESMVKTIMDCITTSQLNTLWNGNKTEYFNPSRGIRQGDPLSPYIFVIRMDKLSHIITEALNNKYWSHMCAGKRGPVITHLMFVDDLLFSEAMMTHAQCVLDCLNKFCSMSGQKVSSEKTSMFFPRNVNNELRKEIARLTSFKTTTNLATTWELH